MARQQLDAAEGKEGTMMARRSIVGVLVLFLLGVIAGAPLVPTAAGAQPICRYGFDLSLGTVQTSPQPAGTTIRIKGPSPDAMSADMCYIAEYQFLAVSQDGTRTVLYDGPSNVVDWSTAPFAAGSYVLQLWAFYSTGYLAAAPRLPFTLTVPTSAGSGGYSPGVTSGPRCAPVCRMQ